MNFNHNIIIISKVVHKGFWHTGMIWEIKCSKCDLYYHYVYKNLKSAIKLFRSRDKPHLFLDKPLSKSFVERKLPKPNPAIYLSKKNGRFTLSSLHHSGKKIKDFKCKLSDEYVLVRDIIK